MTRLAILCICIVLTAALPGAAAEYFVATGGDDAANGASPATAVRTVGRGLTLLTPGDTLTILPGEYFGANSVRLAGTPDAPIIIRAARPGSVLLRGDVDLHGFERLPGTRYTWWAAFDREVEGVGENDTAASYAFVPSVPEVEEVRGSCYYDSEARRLYVHTSDSGPADSHALSVSVTNGFGILIQPPAGEGTAHDIVIDGLAAGGYRNRELAPNPGSNTRWGFYIVEAERCTIRRCTAFLNGGGIALVRPKDCLIEDCVAFGNYSTFNSSGGNIICWTPATNTIQRRNTVHSTKSNGIRFYGGGSENCALEGNLAWDCAYGEIWIKGGANATSRIVGNVSLGAIYNSGGVAQENIHHNLGSYGSEIEDTVSNIWFSRIPRFDFDRNFADSVNHDYRLQSDAPLRGTGPNGTDPGPFPYVGDVFFVSPEGDDTAAGTSVATAWRTLAHAAAAAEPGQTVYLLAGTYREALQPARSGTADAPIVFRRRGRDRVVLDGQGALATGVVLDGRSYISVEGLTVIGCTGPGVRASDGEGLTIRECVLLGNGQGMVGSGLADFTVRNCLFRDNEAEGLRLEGCAAPSGEVTSTVFDRNGGPALAVDETTAAVLWSDYNAIAPGARLSLAGTPMDLAAWQGATDLDAHSLSHVPEYRDPAAGDLGLQDGSLLPGRGALATNIGPYRRDAVQAPLRIEGVQVHSVTATTANLEWWTPTTEATTKLEWGETPECANVIENIYNASIFHTVSLTGLTPGTRYYFRVSATAPATEFHTNLDLARLEAEKVREVATAEVAGFETLAADGPPRTFHVALGGDDASDGLSLATAWRTLRHAAGQVRAGDTVLIHEGSYEEHVPIRATGDEGWPITFRAAPGEQVWLDGSGQKRPTAIRIAFKQHVHLNGLRLHNFRASRYESDADAGAVEIVGGAHNVLSRCFYDGRARTYMPYFVAGRGTEDLLLENCVIINGWNGAAFQHCPELTIRHCVFYNCLIQALHVYNPPDQPVTLSHNIFCDNIPDKVRNPIAWIWHLETLRSAYNCWFMRLPAEERMVIGYGRLGGELVSAQATFPELQERFGLEAGGVYANPGMRVVAELTPPGGPAADYDRLEMHRAGAEIEPLDFADFFADPAGPAARAADGRPMGLDPAAFAE